MSHTRTRRARYRFGNGLRLLHQPSIMAKPLEPPWVTSAYVAAALK